MAARQRSRGHRDADRRRESAQGRRNVAARPRAREVRRARLGVEGGVRLDDHEPDATARHVGRLVARALHDGRGAVRSGTRHVRAAVRRQPHLPRQAPRQLGSDARHGRVGPRGRQRRGAGKALGAALSVRRWDGLGRRRDDPSRNDAGRRRGRRESRRRSLPRARRQDGDAAAHGTDDPGHRRRLRRQGLRHRLREDYTGARLQRLADRPAPRPRADRHSRSRGEGQCQCAGEVSRHGPLRCAQGSSGRPRGARSRCLREAAQDGRAALRAYGRGCRADADRSVVRRDACVRSGNASVFPRPLDPGPLPRRSRRRCDEPARWHHRPGRIRPGRVAVDLPPLDQQHPGLVHLAPALVGPPDPGVVRRSGQRLRRARRGGRTGPGAREARPGSCPLRAGPRRARHVVLVGAVVPLDLGWPRGHDGNCGRSCRRRCW